MATAGLRLAAPHHILLNRGRDGKRQRTELSAPRCHYGVYRAR